MQKIGSGLRLFFRTHNESIAQLYFCGGDFDFLDSTNMHGRRRINDDVSVVAVCGSFAILVID